MKKEFSFILAMLIFSTIGPIVKIIPLTSIEIAAFRALIASLFLAFFIKKGDPFSKKDLCLTLISGIFIGLNWIFLFESYHYIDVSNATLIYYLAPTLVVLGSYLFFKEKISKTRIPLLVLSFVGFILLCDLKMDYSFQGILYALMAALLYASVILINRQNKMKATLKTFLQFSAASLLLMPYLFFTNEGLIIIPLKPFLLLLILGIVHTGIAYLLYFDAIRGLSSLKIALYSYIDPVFSVILSICILKEGFSLLECIGMALILISSFLNERLK